jgi:hypothetical protein
MGRKHARRTAARSRCGARLRRTGTGPERVLRRLRRGRRLRGAELGRGPRGQQRLTTKFALGGEGTFDVVRTDTFDSANFAALNLMFNWYWSRG